MITRSSRYLITTVLAVLGAAVSTYLGLAARDHNILVCGVGDCAAVQSSTYAKVNGISIAWFGLMMYLAILAMSLLRETRKYASPTISGALLFLALTGTLYSAYLTYLELFVINAICQWCVVSAVLVLTITVVEITRYLAAEPGT